MRIYKLICLIALFLVLTIIPLYISTGENLGDVEISILEDSLDVLCLVNRDHLLEKNYPDQNIPKYKLEEVKLPTTKGKHLLRGVANIALNALFEAAYAENIRLFVGSSYRTYRTQEVMHYNRVKRIGFDDGYVQKAGASEHQTGLAVDVVSSEYTNMFQKSFGETQEGRWLRENCAEFGFIIRYPENKEEITGISYEPWHLRYVGKEVASYIMDNDLTLEEFSARRIVALGAYYGEAMSWDN